MQSIPLYNGGDTQAEYEVGVAAFKDLENVNYHVPLFECMQSKGVVEPGQRRLIECLFSPMEPMKYSVSSVSVYKLVLVDLQFKFINTFNVLQLLPLELLTSFFVELLTSL